MVHEFDELLAACEVADEFQREMERWPDVVERCERCGEEMEQYGGESCCPACWRFVPVA